MTDTPLILDWAGNPAPSSAAAPVTNRPATALYSYQGGILSLGSDYVSGNARAQTPKIDQYGTQYVATANPAGQPAQVYTSQPAPAALSQYGNLTMARQDLPAPSTYYPLNVDMNLALNVHHKSKQTFRAIAVGVSCSANKSLMTLIYASTGTMVLRLNECTVYVPPSGVGGTGLLGGSGSTTYYPLICELRRILTATGGSSITPVSGDTGDTLTSGVTCASGATAGATINTFHRQDAIVTTNTGLPWYGRGDHNEKTFVIRPGEGLTVTCVSSGTVNSSSGNGTTTASVDVEITFTQASA